MAISPQFKDELRNRVTLSDYIGRKISVTRAGREFKACCPFHNEKTPSFTINDQKGFYHCFGCGAHGDVINFAMQYDNLPFMQAIEVLAAEAGLQVPKPTPKEQEAYQKRDRLIMVCEAASKWFEVQLCQPKNKDILDYLLKRGLSDETIQRFKVGFAPDRMEDLRLALQQQGFTNQEMLEAGLVKQGKSGREPYAFFRGRVMFPVTDVRGRVIAFGGRVIPEYVRARPPSDFEPPKYINTGDTYLFNKGELLYAHALAREAVAKDNHVLVVEGYMDAIALHQAGYQGAVAPLGTALTESQIELCWRMIPLDSKAPILCFDGDNAGKRAAYRSVERVLSILKPNHSLKFLFLPAGEDPDSYIKAKGKRAFDKLLHGTKDLIDVVWNVLLEERDLGTPEAKAGLNKDIDKLISKINDQSVQYYYKSELRNRLFNHFRQKSVYSKSSFSNKRKKGVNIALTQPRIVSGDITAKILISAMIRAPELGEVYEENLAQIEIHDERLDKCRECLISAISDKRSDVREHIQNLGLDSYLQVLQEEFDRDAQYNWVNTTEDIESFKMKLNEHIQLRGRKNRVLTGF